LKPFPKIETERLILSKLKAEDIPAIVQYAGNKKISDYTSHIPFPYEEKDAIFWLNQAQEGYRNGTHLTLGIHLKSSSAFIGGIGLTINQRYNRAELGYWIAEAEWNKGFTSEAAKALIDYAFQEMGLHKITSSYMSMNPASGKVMEKCGMHKEGEQKDQILKNGVYLDLILYGLTIDQYEKISAKSR